MHVLVLGANSAMALALASEFAARDGAALTLASRNVECLERHAADLRIRHQVEVRTAAFDAVDFASHRDFYASLASRPDVVVAAFGMLGDQHAAEMDVEQLRAMVDVNFTGAASILEIVAADFETVQRGSIIAYASPAGQRGRQSNYIYGAAKGALIVYLSGLRHRLHRAGVHVLTVVPGFVRTKMTEHMDLPPALTADPEETARDIHKAWRKRKTLVYTKWMWRWVMLIIRNLPERLFLKSNL